MALLENSITLLKKKQSNTSQTSRKHTSKSPYELSFTQHQSKMKTQYNVVTHTRAHMHTHAQMHTRAPVHTQLHEG